MVQARKICSKHPNVKAATKLSCVQESFLKQKGNEKCFIVEVATESSISVR